MKRFSVIFWVVLFGITPQVFASNTLSKLTQFGDNPGDIDGYFAKGRQSAPLVVLMHGCGQTADMFYSNSGFNQLSKQHGFSVLIPQQRNTNNATLCFNWFSPLDQSKDKGEIASIINMINHVKNEHNIPSVYIFGLSAGGAMAVNLMSHYPESFDAGVIVAGISYPCADSLVKAISCMKSGSAYSPEKLNQTLQNKKTTWPNMIIVTGNEDNIVNPINASQMAQQWRLLHKVPKTSKVEQHQGYQLQSWGNGEVSLLEFDGLGHGLPVKPNSPTGGTEAPFFIAAPISIAEFAVNSWLKGN